MAYLVATLLIAAAIHHFVELPIARIRRRFSRVTPVVSTSPSTSTPPRPRIGAARAADAVVIEAVAGG